MQETKDDGRGVVRPGLFRRGHDMFMFHRVNEPFFVNTYAEGYIVDRDKVRTSIPPDFRLVGRNVVKQHFGQRVLDLIKTLTGISHLRMNRNLKHHWRDFFREQIRKNNSRDREE